jgi:periplasmic divalent cation tolerance protein
MLSMTGGAEPRAGAARVVLTTAPDAEVARSLARLLISRRAAACVSIVPHLTSVYRWEGAVREDQELLLVVKTTAAGALLVERLLAEEHPYDVPECVVLEPTSVAAPYLAWLVGACGPGPAGPVDE